MKKFVKRWHSIWSFCLLLIPLSLSFPVSAQQRNIILATTTSTQDSGLLDRLLPVFEKKTGYFVKTIAVGSGQAIVMGRKGEADVLFVHSPDAEKQLVAEGHGINRRPIMYNDYVVVGPSEDPAKLRRMKSSSESFKRIASAKAMFLSRGDDSGTYAKEKEIWRISGINPERERWYHQTGLGMGQTLHIASEKKGYCLADRGTYLALKKNLGLEVLVEGDALLFNVYHILEVNPTKWPKVNAQGAKAFADFLVSQEAQELIRTFGMDRFGEPLFKPAIGLEKSPLPSSSFGWRSMGMRWE